MKFKRKVIVTVLFILLQIIIANCDLKTLNLKNISALRERYENYEHLSHSTSEIVEIKLLSDNTTEIELLSPPPIPVKNGLTKCCPNNYILKNDLQSGLSCVKKPRDSSNNFDQEKNAMIFDYLIKYKIEYNNNNSIKIPTCSGVKRKILNNRDGKWFTITSSQNSDEYEIKIGLDYFLWAAWIPIDKSSGYCLDMDEFAYANCADNSTNSSNFVCEQDPVLIFCQLEQDKLQEFTIHRYLYGLTSLATCVPILVTLVLFVHLKIHQNPRKWILMSYFSSYCIACAFHGSQILIYINNLEQEASIWCRILYHVFLYLSCVFGTSCMFISLDIFWCFWKMNSQLGIIQPSKSGIGCILLITWLGPLTIYVGGEIWREYFTNHPPDLAWKKCVSLNLDIIEFLIMIQFVFKFTIYLSTSILIYNHKKSTSFATGAQKDFDKTKTLYAKLFVTTGMPFTCLALDYCFAYENPMALYWIIVRFPHSFIGMYIFLVFGLSTEVRKKWKAAHRNSQETTDLKELKISNTSEQSGNSQSSSKNRKISTLSIWSVANNFNSSLSAKKHNNTPTNTGIESKAAV